MLDRIANTLLAPVAGLATAMGLLLALPALGQSPPPISSAQFDPSDVYFQGYLATRSAEQLETAGDFIGAMEKLQKASQLFETVRKYYPEWKAEMVGGRIGKTTETLARVGPQADAQLLKNRNTVAELEGGVKIPGQMIDPAAGVLPLTPGILEVEPLATRRLADAEAEVKRLRELAAKTGETSRDTSRIGDVIRQRDFLSTQLRAAENNVAALRSRLAAVPMEKEMKTLNQRIATLEQEREAMAMALTQSRGAHTEALSRIAILEADLKLIQQKHADLDRDLKAERKVASSVVAGQRRQLEALEKELARKDAELGKASERISGLINELQESREAFDQLRTERDSLLQERDQMAALLKLNEAGRIQDLIEQNMALAKNLREANEKVDRLNRDSNADQDATTAALRDLAIAKSQINRLHQDKREQDQRLAELESRLKKEELALSKGQVAVDPAEVEVLRDIIKRQLRVQERRRQARDLLVEAAKELGSKDERLAKAIELFDAQEIALSPDRAAAHCGQTGGRRVRLALRAGPGHRRPGHGGTQPRHRRFRAHGREILRRRAPVADPRALSDDPRTAPGPYAVALQVGRRAVAARGTDGCRGYFPPSRRVGRQQPVCLPDARVFPDATGRLAGRGTSGAPFRGSRSERCQEPNAAGHLVLPTRPRE